jgi:hypothetical protein
VVLNPYLKAIFGTLLSGIGAFVTASTVANGASLNASAWATIAFAALSTGGTVLGVTNIPKAPADVPVP